MTTSLTTNTPYNSNSIPGTMQVGADCDIYEINSVQKWALGTQAFRLDGNRYRYVNFVAACGPGKLVSHIVADVDNPSTDAILIAPSSTYQQGVEPVGVYPGAIGSRFVVMTLAGVIKDQFAGGYLTINKDTGQGYIYRIKGNTATGVGTPTATVILISLFDPLQASIDATSDSGIVGSLYTDVKVATPGTDFITVGVTCANMTANTFGWICTYGVCTCLQDGAVTNVGDVITNGVTTPGAYQTMGVGTTQVAAAIGQDILGYSIQVPATNSLTGSYGTIFLRLGA